MTALVRYTFATMLHTQRYLAPVLLFLSVVAVLSSNDSGPLPPVYGLSAGALFVCSTWFTIALINIEDPVQRAIITVSTGRSYSTMLSSIAVAGLSCLVLAVTGLVLPLLVGNHSVAIVDLIVGFEAQLVSVSAGMAIGLLCSRLVIRRQGYALIVAIGLVMVALLAPGLVPVNALIRLMSNSSKSSDLLVPASGLLAIAVVVLFASGVATQFLTTRKD